MLNRRILRIEALQTMFAYVQGKNSLKQMARDRISAFFDPDLNSMVSQDRKLLSAQKREALKIFDEHIEDLDPVCKNDDNRIEKAVNEAFIDYQNNLKKDTTSLKKRMIADVEATYSTYLAVLQLLVEFKNIASQIKSNFAPGIGNFVKNLLISKIECDNTLQHSILANKISWDKNKDQIREWYRDIVKKDEKFENYLNLDSTSFEIDKEIVNHLLRDIILKNPVIGSFFEEQDLKWSEHESVVKGMIKKAMKVLKEDEEFPQMVISSDWEEDKSFFEELFARAVEEERNIDELIEGKTKNWELDRIALTDKIILGLAVAELKNFPNIPIKVTINEYIEVSKRYSTPKSKEFINGVLDGITKELIDRGLIRKSGKGLLDNK